MPPPPDRSALSPRAIVRDLWTTALGLPPALLDPDPDPGSDGDDDDGDDGGPLVLPGLDGRTESLAGVDVEQPALPSSFRIGALAQSVVALAGLAAALADSTRPPSPPPPTTTAAREASQNAAVDAAASSPSSSSPSSTHRLRLPKVTVPLRHAVAEFQSERLYTLVPHHTSSASSPSPSSSSPCPAAAAAAAVVGGLYATPLDGSAVRIHDALPNHARAALDLLGLGGPAGPYAADDDDDDGDDGSSAADDEAAAAAAARLKSGGEQRGRDRDCNANESNGIDNCKGDTNSTSTSTSRQHRAVSRADIARRVALHTSLQLEHLAHETPSGAVLYALRSYAQWDAHPQAAHTPDSPVLIRRIAMPSSSSSSSPSPSWPLRPIPSSSSSPLTSDQHTTPRGCLAGLRVLELSRIIAAPVAGRTLAAHGASVLWLTSPTLPTLPALDVDLARGKRTIQLDLDSAAEDDHPGQQMRLLHALIRDADVVIQGYRPGSLAARFGLTPEHLARINPRLAVVANLSAFGPAGPWAGRRGFDSLVQTCTGMNVSEAAHRAGRADDDDDHYHIDEHDHDDDDEQDHNDDSDNDDDNEDNGDETNRKAHHHHHPPALPLPCQALDHASGHLLAAGICAALYRRAAAAAAAPDVDGHGYGHGDGHRHGDGGDGDGSSSGPYIVDVSLSATARYLRSLGQYPGARGFSSVSSSSSPPSSTSSLAAHAGQAAADGGDHLHGGGGDGTQDDFFETRETGLGTLTAVRHSAAVEGRRVGWDVMPKPLGSDEPRWP
ncbi:hypothetical protein JDV02_005493 [Purpureocillium takamizusanense]|uniref:CoA-transferase family III n=1 Tax=Purpureocillium takamizusanense TaxID=2060973 RepID=A0A9Q8QHI7_9HYPO|nr:uncharacterized protein JDV02_005493 [Purpureocillium takamizusanense]UNI19301.1 hypothetical protein JDV02_005493 [Purpureocillium takamizusanense]